VNIQTLDQPPTTPRCSWWLIWARTRLRTWTSRWNTFKASIRQGQAGKPSMYNLAGRKKLLTVLNDVCVFPIVCVCLQHFASFNENLYEFVERFCSPITSLHGYNMLQRLGLTDFVCHQIPSSILQDTMKDLKLQKEQSNEYAQSSILRLHLFAISHWICLEMGYTFIPYAMLYHMHPFRSVIFVGIGYISYPI